MLEAEAEQAARIQRSLQDERLAVARDLHDVVSHHLSGIVLQAAAVRRRAGGSDERVLAIIEDAGRDALAGLQTMVGTRESRAVRRPAPGVAEIEALVATYADRHDPVDLVIDPAGRARAGEHPRDGVPGRAGGADQRGQALRG